MTTKNVCKFEKFGYCNQKEECKDYHPTEICKKTNCNVSRCKRRHPRPCKYFESGYCKFKEYCKYDHKEKIKNDDLLERLMKLEKQIKILRDINGQQENSIFVLNERLSEVEIENKSLHRKLSKEENKSNGDTLVTDDSSRKRKFEDNVTKTSQNVSAKVSRNEIEFSVDVENKIKEVKEEIVGKSFEDGKQILRNFQQNVNQNVQKINIKIAYSGNKEEAFVNVINKFNIECNKIITKSFKTPIGFRASIEDKLESFLNDLINLRNLKQQI